MLEACLGGELRALLRRAICFDADTSRFYAACAASALGHLHEQSIVYRDCKPANIVLDAAGYIRIVDFGFSKVRSTTHPPYITNPYSRHAPSLLRPDPLQPPYASPPAA